MKTDQTNKSQKMSFFIFQLMMVDIVFSLDSVITAIGMVKQISIMVFAMFIAMFFSFMVEIVNMRYRVKKKTV